MYDASLCGVVFSSVIGTKPSFFHLGVLLIGLAITCHKSLTYFVFYPFFRLLFGTLYPAYASYKAVRTKNVKEYVSRNFYYLNVICIIRLVIVVDIFFSEYCRGINLKKIGSESAKLSKKTENCSAIRVGFLR